MVWLAVSLNVPFTEFGLSFGDVLLGSGDFFILTEVWNIVIFNFFIWWSEIKSSSAHLAFERGARWSRFKLNKAVNVGSACFIILPVVVLKTPG